jgi:hypothetical protein
MLCWMPDHHSVNDIVLFEVPTRSGATGLLAELSSSNLAWMERGDELAVVGVLLDGDDGDLARLLRRVERWTTEQRGLLAIRFEVDGRTYVLQPSLPAREVTAA